MNRSTLGYGFDPPRARGLDAATLLTANGNRGLQLLSPAVLGAVDLELERLRALGIQAVVLASRMRPGSTTVTSESPGYRAEPASWPTVSSMPANSPRAEPRTMGAMWRCRSTDHGLTQARVRVLPPLVPVARLPHDYHRPRPPRWFGAPDEVAKPLARPGANQA